MERQATKNKRFVLPTGLHHLLMQTARLAAAVTTGLVLMTGLIFAMNALHLPRQFKGFHVIDFSIAVISIVAVVSGIAVYHGSGLLLIRRIPARCHYCGGPASFEERIVPQYRCRSCGGVSPLEKRKPGKTRKSRRKEPVADFRENALVITNYEFPQGSIVSDREIPAKDITAVFRAFEPAFVLQNREVVFLPYDSRDAFKAFVQRNTIPESTDKVEVWSVLLDPFLDTEYTASDREGGYRVLEDNGISRSEVDEIRKRVESVMHEATFRTWEWAHYSTYDLLQAMKTLRPRKFTSEFYWWVMEIALRNYRSQAPSSLKGRFVAVWKGLCGKGDAGAVFARLTAAYAEPHRFYHTLDHVRACLRELDRVRQHTDYSDRVEMALWFHDAVYDVQRHASSGPGNEERSAGWAVRELQKGGVPELVVSRIKELILATRHVTVPEDRDARLIMDIDLAIFGRPLAEFDEYERKIRQEYAHVPEDRYRAARIKVLERFLGRDFIYLTPFFRESYETRARENLRRSVEMLRVP